MKKMVCEICESTDLVKQDGIFVCQGCGTKYSVEEAKKLLQEVEGETAAPAATSAKNADLDKYLLLARRAKDSSNSADAAKYYGMAESEDPSNWESAFYSVYYTAMQTNIAGISSAAALVKNCLHAVVDLVKENVPAGEQAKVAEELTSRCNEIAAMLKISARNHYNGIGASIQANYTGELRGRAQAAVMLPITLGDELEAALGSNAACHKAIAQAWEFAINMLESDSFSYPNESTRITYLLEKISKYDATYARPRIEKQIASIDGQIAKLSIPTKKGGCGAGFLIGLGIIYLFSIWAGVMEFTFDEDVIPYLLPGLAFVVLGVILYIPKPKSEKQLAADRAQIEKLNAEKQRLGNLIK